MTKRVVKNLTMASFMAYGGFVKLPAGPCSGLEDIVVGETQTEVSAEPTKEPLLKWIILQSAGGNPSK